MAINLLPKEILIQRRYLSKLSLISKISVVALITMVLLTSVVITARLSQNIKFNQAKQNLSLSEDRLKSLSSKENDINILKNRLGSIQSLYGIDSKKKAIFNVVISLIPSNVRISDINVDRSGKTLLTLESSSLTGLDTLISDLSTKEKNSGLITKIELEGLTFGKDAVYRISLKIS